MPVSPEKLKELDLRMQVLGVSEDDFEETFIRSSGPGGQKVNKSSSCVYLVHIPTGLSVKCQRERSQSLNRFLARRLLLDKIEKQQKSFIAAEKEKIEKIRRQKRKRSKRAKEKILENKRRQAMKKELRGKITPEAGG
ncbi:MAG TPA: peptide chain release factor-like protein [Smithellaceae bacterium]|nr:peptide chain release factor-like protein [Smithellaceae bacterium]HQF83742.1 peptide chain release factor-like protein [Smithellaceae bacterium]HQG79859.1 peptide chain release factor-like protein [Smithellaceae bacterium]